MHYKILFLTMSCEDPFFIMGRKVVEDTWARDIIDNKHSGIGYYAYTSSSNGIEYIDGHTIYVNAPDGLEGTYQKTKAVLEFLRNNNITFDKLVRTNASVYFNINKMIEFIDFKKEYNIMAPGLFCKFSNENGFIKNIPIYCGFALIINSDIIYTVIDNDDINKIYEYRDAIRLGFPDADDVRLSFILYTLENKGILNIEKYIWEEQNTIKYKNVPLNPYVKFSEDYLEPIVYDPSVINHVPFLKIRLCAVSKPEYRYMEFEHMYEVDNALIRD